jgi:hypothetical protein
VALSDIKARLKTVLEGVTGIGVVYEYVRWGNDEKAWKEIFTTSDQKFHCWQITRRSTGEDQVSFPSVNSRVHEMQIMGFLGLKDVDDTEATFQNLIEAICTDLRDEAKDPPLNGQAFKVEAPQVENVGHKVIAGVLSHSCDIIINVHEYVNY